MRAATNRRLHRRRGRTANERSARFDVTPGLVVAVCGLHGGAGTTDVTAALAACAAEAASRAPVLAVEGDPGAGELAGRLGASREWSLARASALAAGGSDSGTLPFVERDDGLRVLASVASDVGDSEPHRVAAALAEARRVHGLVVIDAGTIHGRAATTCLSVADSVVWTARAERLAETVRRLEGALARPARRARWLLAVGGGRVPRRAVDGVRDDLHARVTLPSELGRSVRWADELLDVLTAP